MWAKQLSFCYYFKMQESFELAQGVKERVLWRKSEKLKVCKL